MRAFEIVNEIITPVFKNTQKTVMHNIPAGVKAAYGRGTLGMGAFGYTQDTPNDPGTVTKTAYDSGSVKRSPFVDAYYVWAKVTSTGSRAASNPFLPRIYVVDDRMDVDGVSLPRYQVEKLHNPNDPLITSEMLIAIMEQIGMSDDQFDPTYSKTALWQAISSQLGWRRTDNQKLLEALDLAQDIVDVWNLHYRWSGYHMGQTPTIFLDLHPGNIMIRITSVGPQLVLIDPIAGAVYHYKVADFLEERY